MAKKPRSPHVPEPTPEDTLVMDPGAAARTQRMDSQPPGALEATRILNPGAGDVTLSGTAAQPGPEGSQDAADPGATRAMPVPPEPVPEPSLPPTLPRPTILLHPALDELEAGTPPPRPLGFWVAAGVGLAVVAGGLWYATQDRPPAAPAPVAAADQPPPPPAVPTGYQDTLRQAEGGDVAAMRTLGAVYTYGLGVPPHRQEGLRWYRKAAEAGSAVAAEELKALEGGVKK